MDIRGKEIPRVYYYLLAVFVVSLLVRLFVVLFMLPEEYKVPTTDGKEYDSVAMGIVSGEGYSLYGSGKPTSEMPPGYPAFLALIYAVFGRNYLAVQIVQSVLGSLLCVLVYFVGKETIDERIGLWASMVSALYIPFIYHHYYGGPAFFYSEGLYMFLLSLSIYCFMKIHKTEKVLFGILGGLFLGTASLTRPIILLFILPVVFILSFSLINQGRGYREVVFKVVLPIMLSFGCVISIWTLRNYMVHDRFIPVATHMGMPFLGGNNIRAGGSWVDKNSIPGYDHKYVESLPEIEREKIRLKLGLEFLRDHPGRIPKLFLKKVLITWSNFREMDVPIYNVPYSILLPFFIGGVMFWYFRR